MQPQQQPQHKKQLQHHQELKISNNPTAASAAKAARVATAETVQQ
jgi:hypothetical protein